jgi:hypothetical protein
MRALRMSGFIGSLGSGGSDRNYVAKMEEALRIARSMGDDVRLAGVLNWFAEIEVKYDLSRAAALGRESLAIERRIRDRQSGNQASNLSGYLLGIGEVDDGISLAREALQSARASNVFTDVVYVLQRLTLGATLRDRFDEAARLLGFVDAQFARLDLGIDFAEELVRKQTVETLEAALAPQRLAELMREGAEMGDADAIALALAATA